MKTASQLFEERRQFAIDAINRLACTDDVTREYVNAVRAVAGLAATSDADQMVECTADELATLIPVVQLDGWENESDYRYDDARDMGATA